MAHQFSLVLASVEPGKKHDPRGYDWCWACSVSSGESRRRRRNASSQRSKLIVVMRTPSSLDEPPFSSWTRRHHQSSELHAHRPQNRYVRVCMHFWPCDERGTHTTRGVAESQQQQLRVTWSIWVMAGRARARGRLPSLASRRSKMRMGWVCGTLRATPRSLLRIPFSPSTTRPPLLVRRLSIPARSLAVESQLPVRRNRKPHAWTLA
ncbi:hypothetical protein B0H11DRAFT_1304106 [Mycena galericulata]|nr:hypothetical protein B0H11DRAFT_1304106 [Mycena galericulata]